MSVATGIGRYARTAGRGFALNFTVDAFLQVLTLVQNLLVPRLVGPDVMGLFALGMAIVGVGSSLRELGVHEKLVQDRDADLPRAYAVAFTVELALSTALVILAIATAPLVGALFDRPDLVPVVALLAFTIYTTALLNLPSALHLRELDYARRNLLLSAGPVTRFAVTVPLAFAGAGVWSLVAGVLAAFVVSTIVVWAGAPLRPRFRLERRVLRRYFDYGWPLWVAGLLGITTTWAGMFVITGFLGVAALGFVSVPRRIAEQAVRIETVLAQTMFPALVRARDDVEGKRRAFTVANRVTMLWAAPLGLGLVIFASDLVEFVLGPAWRPAVVVFVAQGLNIAVGAVGHSFDVFFRAKGDTRPTLWFHAIGELWVFLVLLPAVAVWGLPGAAAAIGSRGPLAVAVRQWMIRREFPGYRLFGNVKREMVAAAVPAAFVGFLRWQVFAPDSLLEFAGMLVGFAACAAASLLLADRALLRRIVRVIRRPPEQPPGTAGGPGAVGTVAPRREPLPGRFPLGAAVDPTSGRLWVTLRDSSTVAVREHDGTWRTWRLPAYPHIPAIDDHGHAWLALTIAGRIAEVDPTSGHVGQRRLRGSRDLLGTAWDGERVHVVDGSQKVLWTVDPEGGSPTATAIPRSARRPDLVVAPSTEGCWITDTGRPVLLHWTDGAWEEIGVTDGTRGIVADRVRGELWLGHTSRPLVTRLSTDDPDDALVAGVPGTPFGLALSQDGALWAAIPDEDLVARVGRDGSSETLRLRPGSQPRALAWDDGSLHILCSGDHTLVTIHGAT